MSTPANRHNISQNSMPLTAVHKTKESAIRVDHIVPLRRGGTHDPINLQVLCPKCNIGKGARPWENFLISQRRAATKRRMLHNKE